MTNPDPICLSLYAMATRFELVLHGDDTSHLRAAGEEALEEIERLDAQLSLYRPSSELSWINLHAANEPIKVEPRLFRLLQHAAELTEKTGGAFDVTVAPLMRAWGFVRGTGQMASTEQLESALAIVDMGHVLLSEDDLTIRFDREGVEIDLGAIGKGYAIERAVESLRENGVTSALLHGGTSTIYGIGAPPNTDAWRVAIRKPGTDASTHGPVDTVDLRDSSLSVSAVHGKSFMDGSREYGHVIDPRSGTPVQSALLAAVTGPSPTQTDALSTALLVLGDGWLPDLRDRFPACSALVVTQSDSGPQVTVSN